MKIKIIDKLILKLKSIRLFGVEHITIYDLLKLYVNGLVEGMFTYRSGAISFSFFMALFPALLFILNLIPFVPIDNFQEDFLMFLDNLLPPNTSDLFQSIFVDIAKNQRSGLLSSVGILSIFLMANGTNAILGSFSNSYHTVHSRTLIKQYLIALALGIAQVLIFLVVVILYVYFQVYILPNINKYASIIQENQLFWLSIVQYVLFVSMVYFFTAALYYFGTSKEKIKFFSLGAFFTTILIVVTTFLFGIYIQNFSQYNQIYGSIGAILIIMLYIWINCNILLLGYELNATINALKRKKDTDLFENAV